MWKYITNQLLLTILGNILLSEIIKYIEYILKHLIKHVYI